MLSICSIFTIVLSVVGVIGVDYSKLWVDSLLFFRSGEWGSCPFFHFRFFGGADVPTIFTDSDHPLPPIKNLRTFFCG